MSRVALYAQFALVCFALAFTSSARAQQPAPTISVLTFGPGDHTFSKFGHDALWVHDPSLPPGQRDRVYNYGTFRFDSPWLILDFLEGDLQYWLSVSTLRGTLRAYASVNRSVSAQTLAIPDATAREIVRFLENNLKPENRYYRYDYYRDNCSTRIRDLLLQHLGPKFRGEASNLPARWTYREHTRRLTADSPLLYLALDIAMGPLIDSDVTRWDEQFLPAQLEEHLSTLSATLDPPLVTSQRLLVSAERPPEASTPPSSHLRWAVWGALIGALFLGLGSVARQRWARIVSYAAWSLWSIAIGLLGLALCILSGLTDHDVTYWNANILLAPPWALAIPYAIRSWLGPAPTRRALRWVLSLMLSACAGVLVLLFSPQRSEPAVALLLPIWFGIGSGALLLWRNTQSVVAPQPATATGGA